MERYIKRITKEEKDQLLNSIIRTTESGLSVESIIRIGRVVCEEAERDAQAIQQRCKEFEEIIGRR